MNHALSPATQITLLFDGQCPLCRREVRFLQRMDRHRGRLGAIDITLPEFDASAFGLTPQRVHARIHAQLADGSVIEGMEVFRRAYRAVGLGWLLTWTRWPLIKPLVDRFYTWFARNRYRLTGRRDCSAGACRPHG